MLDALGKHIILEMWGCCKDTIDNVEVAKGNSCQGSGVC